MSPSGRLTRASTRNSTISSRGQQELTRSRQTPRGSSRAQQGSTPTGGRGRGTLQQPRIDKSLNLKPGKRSYQQSTSSSNAKKNEFFKDEGVVKAIELGGGFSLNLGSSQSEGGSATSTPKSSISVKSRTSQVSLGEKNTLAVSISTTGLSREEEEEILKEFDLNCLYGACRGISRTERYERALRYKIIPHPPETIGKILEAHQGDKRYEHCIWDKNELLRIGT